MNKKTDMKEYIRSPKWCRVLKVVTGLLVIAGIAAALLHGATKGEDAEPSRFYENGPGKAEQPVYIDIVGISDWIYKVGDDTTYYAVEDADNFVYLIEWGDRKASDDAALKPYEEYWDRESDDAKQPEPMRISGCSQKTVAAVKDAVSEVFEVPSDEYEGYFGPYYCNVNAKPTDVINLVSILTAVFSFLAWVVFAAVTGANKRNTKKCLAALKQKGLLEAAETEFGSEETVEDGDSAKLGNTFFYGKGSGVVVPYADILWYYNSATFARGVQTNSALVIATDYLKPTAALNVVGPDIARLIDTAGEAIYQHNPTAARGMSKESKQEYKRLKAGK